MCTVHHIAWNKALTEWMPRERADLRVTPATDQTARTVPHSKARLAAGSTDGVVREKCGRCAFGNDAHV
jgi:hypothetical protein